MTPVFFRKDIFYAEIPEELAAKHSARADGAGRS
jgi:hypothetical protein